MAIPFLAAIRSIRVWHGRFRGSALRRRAAILTGCLALACATLQPASATTVTRKQEARDQFEKAEQLREDLNSRDEDQRTRKDYRRVADAYRRVYYLDPASSKADISVFNVAVVLTEMGRQFQPGDKDFRSAIAQYGFLRREYPGSKYRMQALYAIGQIYRQDLHDEDAARSSFEEFLHRYPKDPLAPAVQQELAALDEPPTKRKSSEEVRADKPEPPKKTKPAEETSTEKPESAKKTKLVEEARTDKPEPTTTSEAFVPVTGKKLAELPAVTGIRHWSTPDYTRVAIDIDSEVKYEAGRVANPDRIFFDLPNTRLATNFGGKNLDISDSFLKRIRVAQYQPGYTRVVLEVADVSDYSAFLLPNPYRLIIDIHGRQHQTETKIAKTADAPAGVTEILPEKSYRSVEKANETAGKSASRQVKNEEPATPTSASTKSGHRVVVDNDDDSPSTRKRDSHVSKSSEPDDVNADVAKVNTKARSTQPQSSDPLFASARDGSGPELKATSEPTSAPTAIAVAPRAKSSKNLASAAVTTHEAEPTSSGDRSLTRALGLKIGRIVIDAGHGGHDTGTIGPNGLMEKEVVLDVALRLGRMLENRLGADVIYTRSDDTFIPLETRTAIANQHQADLFVSIHANSSSDPDARGVETYYLNFTSNPDALEVAARENAVSQKSIFQLQDLVKKITLKEKIEESRELASDVQQSLYTGLAGRRSDLKDRGVKKAPFVVLIGANMPSILAEVSFVSNPTDETKMETPEYRQKIAESIYKGISKYASGLSGIKIATKFNKEAGQ